MKCSSFCLRYGPHVWSNVFSGGKPTGLFNQGAALSLQILQEKALDILCLVPCNFESIELAFDDLGLWGFDQVNLSCNTSADRRNASCIVDH